MDWISVEKELPKDGEEVIAYSEKNRIVFICTCLESYIKKHGNYDGATHWIPFENQKIDKYSMLWVMIISQITRPDLLPGMLSQIVKN